MRCIIKNIPLPTFGIAGNRGVGFPLVDYCSVLTQPIVEDTNCYLVKEEDGLTEILTEIDKQINVTCTAPESDGVCYIVLQEDGSTPLGQQENSEDLFYCSEVVRDVCYLVARQDSSWQIIDQQNRESILVGCS